MADPVTVGELFKLYYEKHILVNAKRPENIYYWGTVHGPRWFDVPIVDLNRKLIQEWVDDLGQRSKSSANRAVNVLASMLYWGIRREYCAEPNPCRWVDRFREKSRDRYLQPEELEQFKTVLSQESQRTQDFIWLLLYTGARKSNVLAMRWDQISLSSKTWTIAGDDHKNFTTNVIALSEQAIEILERRQRTTTGQWVFPGRLPDSHYLEPKRMWKALTKKAGLENLRIHDLRRTVGSYMAISGCSLPVIGKALGHKDWRSTLIYARLDLGPVRDAYREVFKIIDLDRQDRRNTSSPSEVIEFPKQPSNYNQLQDNDSKVLDPFLQTIVEGKILACIFDTSSSGGKTKKAFHRKLGGKLAINASQLDFVLTELERKQLIYKTIDENSASGKLVTYNLKISVAAKATNTNSGLQSAS